MEGSTCRSSPKAPGGHQVTQRDLRWNKEQEETQAFKAQGAPEPIPAPTQRRDFLPRSPLGAFLTAYLWGD